MAARSTLYQLMDRLRSMGQVTSSDWSLGTANFWDMDQLQHVLENHRHDLVRVPLQTIPSYVNGTISYFTYAAPYGNFEQTDQGGSAIFVVEDGSGNMRGTALWSADYIRGVVTFVANQRGTAFYLTARAYDLNGAAADIWRSKADHYAVSHFDFSTDNMRVNRSQVVTNSLTMAERYEAKAWAYSAPLQRGDEEWDW